MSRLNSTLIALVLGATAVAGLFAAVRTVRLGQSVPASQTVSATPQELAARRAKLERWSRSLEHARTKHPPALPKLPKFAPVHVTAAQPSASAATGGTAPPVKYVRPAPVIEYQQAAQPATSTSAQSSRADEGSEQGTSGGGGGDD